MQFASINFRDKRRKNVEVLAVVGGAAYIMFIYTIETNTSYIAM